ncbi:hypothetical protein BN1088_1432988 [Sphingobacterium sp. PM2-P1-29]|nr:hypothetical protein BN1088_1432988 [Sphingobacterium sp. PM2-P1-29]
MVYVLFYAKVFLCDFYKLKPFLIPFFPSINLSQKKRLYYLFILYLWYRCHTNQF